LIVGRTDSGLIVCTPLPGMLKLMVSPPALLLAHRIACRSEPISLSLVFVTIVLHPVPVAVTLPENSDVLFAASGAVAVHTGPPPRPEGSANVKLKRFVVSVPWLKPLTGVGPYVPVPPSVSAAEPSVNLAKNVFPSPKPVGSGAATKNSITEPGRAKPL